MMSLAAKAWREALPGGWRGMAGRGVPAVTAGGRVEAFSAVAAIVLIAVAGTQHIMESLHAENRGVEARTPSSDGVSRAVALGPELLIAGYGGSPYTYDSDVRFNRAADPKRNMTVERVGWEGQPFKHPLYYGVRVARWGSGGATGAMVDFTHSKAISNMAQSVRLKGTLDGRPLPESARISDYFQKLEFSHGHNMLFLTGLVRLGAVLPQVAPYVGLGAGVSLPHSEVHLHKSDPKRTYEYQYTGPAAQALAGVELRLARVSVFLEYKFTFASYHVPLTGREGTWLGEDLFAQARRWWSGAEPPHGWADTRLASHQVIGGLGVRVALAPAR